MVWYDGINTYGEREGCTTIRYSVGGKWSGMRGYARLGNALYLTSRHIVWRLDAAL